MYKQRWHKKFIAMILSIAMVLGMIPLSASALAAGLPIGTSGEVIAFEKLAPEIAAQTVSLGTSESGLNLPNKLAATVRDSTKPQREEQAETGEPATASVAESVYDSTTPTATGLDLGVNSSGSPDASEPVTMEIPVTWTSAPEYNKDKPGTYSFTAEITGYTLCAEPPAITVTVGEAAQPLAALAGAPVCIFNGVEYTSADSALPNAFYNGGTLTLLQDIVYTNSVTLETHKSLTIELNGHTLTLKALTVKISGNLTLSGEGPGAQLNINNTSASLVAVDVMNSAKATVSNISSAGYAASLSSYGSLRVSGNVQATATGVTLQNSSHASLEISGNLTVSNGDYGINAHSSGGGNSITINGDVRVINTDGTRAVGVYATDSPTIINGALYVQGAEGSWDIKMGSTAVYRSLGQGIYNTSTGYFDYTYWDSKVSVKGYALALDASAGGTSTASVTGPCEGGRKINLTATPSAHHTFAGWTSSAGGSLVNSANASTIFVMPASATTVTANFTYYNTAPARRNGVPATASANVTYGGAYTLNLSDIFADADGDSLTYKVSVNGAEAIGAAASYSFTPASAGTAVLTFTANDGYADSTDSYTVTLTVKKTPTAADLTYQLAAKTYNGLAQPLSVTGPAGLGAITVKYDGSTIQPKDAKTYTVTASIAAGTDYAATTVDIPLGDYTINRRNLTISGTSAKTYDGTTEATGIALTFDGLQNSETLAPGTDYTVTNAQFDSAGAGTNKTVTGTVGLTNSAKAQNYALANGTLNLTGQTISKAAAPAGVNRTLNAVINHAQDYEFDLTTLLPVIGSPRTLGTVTYTIKSPVDTGNVLGTLVYTSGNTLTIPVQSISDANKTAVITVSIKSTNYGDFDADITVTTVDTIPLTIAGLTVNDKTYDGTAESVLSGTAILVTGGVQPGDAVSLSGTPSAVFADANAGANKAVTVTGLSLAGADAHKYRLDLSGLTGTITAKPLTEAMLTVTGGSFTYTGTAQISAITVQDGGTPLVLNADYESMAYSNNTDAGTASVSVTGKGNYQGTISKDFTIGKALLTITGGTIAAKTYDGTTDAEVTGVTFSGLQNGETLTLGTDYTVGGAAFDSASAGSGKTVTATVALSNTAKANNYTLENGSLALTGQTIQKGTVADVSLAIPVVTNLARDYTMSYQEFAGILADLTGKALGTVTYTLTSVENTDGVLAALLPTGPLTFPAIMHVAETADAGKRATLIGTVTSANYDDFTVTVVIKTVDRIPVTISGLTMTGGIYNGSAYAYSGTPLFTSELSGNPVSIPAFDVLYASTDGGGYASSIPPQNAGAYRLTVSVANGNLTYTGSKSYAFTIAKRPVAIRADDKSMTAGSTMPAFTYTVDGLLSGETAFTGTPILTCATDGKTAGSYAISLNLTGISYTGNYTASNPAIVNGTLRVNNPSPSGDGGSGSGNAGGSPTGGSNTTTTNTEMQPNQPVTAVASATATAGANNIGNANIPDKTITDAIAKAQSDGKAQGKTANGIAVALNITMPQETTALTATLSQNALSSLVSSGVSHFEINGAPVSLDLDLKALQEIQKQSTGNITISIAPATGLPKTAKVLLGNRPVYNITISYTDKNGKTQNISSLGNGTATLSIPYTPGKNEAVGYLFGVYVDAKGNATRISGSTYDPNSRSILLGTNHFSVYGVGYEASSAKFTDISTHWGKDSIDYAVGRGLLSGTTKTTFAPNTAVTRGMLVTALGRLAVVDVKAYAESSFTDVKADSAFRPYIEWAYKKGIVQGIGNSQFAPDRAITREEIAVIIVNYAKVTGYKLPVTRTVATFADTSNIGSAYKTAVTAMQQAGIMMGEQNNKFNPKENATRAEVSAMLHRYIKLTIDPATAQGWALNDNGQYLYYKDGKALAGWQTIEGVKYFFNTDGTLQTGWVKEVDNWRYYAGNKAAAGWLDINDKRYYFTKEGIMVSGKWLELDGKWYYFNADGSLAVSATVDGYDIGADGVRKTK